MPRQTGPEYIAYCRSLKFSDTEIRAAMIKAGWQEDDLRNAFMQAPFHSPKHHSVGMKIFWVALVVVVVLALAAVGIVAYLMLNK